MDFGALPRLGKSWSAACIIFAVVLISATDTRPEQNQAYAAGSIQIVGTTIRVERPDGSIAEGAKLIGAILVAAFGDQTLRVRIASVEQDLRDPHGEVLLYDFRVVAEDGSEKPLCNPDPDGRQLGFPLAIESRPEGIRSADDPGHFELVCTSGAQGKCVRFGYAPWRRSPDGRSMLEWYNACVHMVRADYCGDGRPFTRNGTLIDVFDRVNIQKSDGDPSLRFEAAWGPQGAICVARTRIPDLVDLDGLERACPRLTGRLGPATCNEDASGALILNRSR